ncbi:MAG: type IV pilus modification protein PilV [Aquabacterium sp.]
MTPQPTSQRGGMLIEVLVAILIFSVGVLAMVKLQAAAVKQSADAEYRSLAAMLANDLVSRMWGTDRKLDTLQNTYGKAGSASYEDWVASIRDSKLPRALDDNNKPSVSVVSAQGGAQVTITLNWQAPGETDRHQYVTTVLMK